MQLTPDQVRAFVGPNADYYLERWHPIHEEAGSRALGFNWAACFLALSWMIYRRMYRPFWIALTIWVAACMLGGLALVLALSNGAQTLALLTVLGFWALTVGCPVLLGIYGNYWYYLHARRQLGQLTPAGQRDPAALGRMGGTNLWGAVVFGIVAFLVGSWARSGH